MKIIIAEVHKIYNNQSTTISEYPQICESKNKPMTAWGQIT